MSVESRIRNLERESKPPAGDGMCHCGPMGQPVPGVAVFPRDGDEMPAKGPTCPVCGGERAVLVVREEIVGEELHITKETRVRVKGGEPNAEHGS